MQVHPIEVALIESERDEEMLKKRFGLFRGDLSGAVPWVTLLTHRAVVALLVSHFCRMSSLYQYRLHPASLSPRHVWQLSLPIVATHDLGDAPGLQCGRVGPHRRHTLLSLAVHSILFGSLRRSPLQPHQYSFIAKYPSSPPHVSAWLTRHSLDSRKLFNGLGQVLPAITLLVLGFAHPSRLVATILVVRSDL